MLQHACLAGTGQDLQLGVGAEGLQEAADVVADCGLGEVELAAYLSGRVAGGEELEDFHLARGYLGCFFAGERDDALTLARAPDELAHQFDLGGAVAGVVEREGRAVGDAFG